MIKNLRIQNGSKNQSNITERETPFLKPQNQQSNSIILTLKRTFRSEYFNRHNQLKNIANPKKYKSLENLCFHQSIPIEQTNVKKVTTSKIETQEEIFSNNSFKEHSNRFNLLSKQITTINIKNWTQNHVAEWLKVIGLREYVQFFKEQHIQGKHLFDLTQDQLKNQLGIKAYGKRIDFMRQIQFLKKHYKEMVKLNRKSQKARGPIINFINKKKQYQFRSRCHEDIIKQDQQQYNNNSSEQLQKKLQTSINQQIIISSEEQSFMADNQMSSVQRSSKKQFISIQSISTHQLIASAHKKLHWASKYIDSLEQHPYQYLFIRNHQIIITQNITPNLSKGKWLGNQILVKQIPVLIESIHIFIKQLNLVYKLNNLRNPNILQYFGICASGFKRCSLVMELVKGSLDEMLCELSRRKIFWILRGIIQGMMFLHDKNILHKNLKTSNILLDHNYVPKLCNIKLEDRKLLENNYLAPEILRGQQASVHSDVYSFGMIVWQIVNKRKPLSQFSEAQIKGLVGYDNSYQVQCESCDNVFSWIIEKCCKRQRQKRVSFESILVNVQKQIELQQREVQQKCTIVLISMVNIKCM